MASGSDKRPMIAAAGWVALGLVGGVGQTHSASQAASVLSGSAAFAGSGNQKERQISELRISEGGRLPLGVETDILATGRVLVDVRGVRHLGLNFARSHRLPRGKPIGRASVWKRWTGSTP
jgi:hypothetical protein